jgi:hypothetical protein
VNVQGLGQNDSPYFIGRVAPANLWKDNAKTGQAGLGNRAKIIVYGVHWNGDTNTPLPDPKDLPWAWSTTPTTESVASQQLKGGELVVGMWADAAHQVPIILGHIQKTEHFDPKVQPDEVEGKVSFDPFVGKSDDTQETPNNRALSASGLKNLIEDPKSINLALNKGPLFDLKSDFPIDLGGSIDFGSLFSQALSGNLSIESVTGSVTGALSGALTSQVSSLTENLGSISIPGTGIKIDPGATLGAAAQSLTSAAASGDFSSLGSNLGSLGTGALGTLSSQLGGTLTQQFDSIIGENLGGLTESLETALGDIPLAGDVVSSLTGSLGSLASSTADSLVLSALSGSVNTGAITGDVVAQLNSILTNSINKVGTINSPVVQPNVNIAESLEGVAEELVKEVATALVSSVPSSINLSSLIPSLNLGLAAAQASGTFYVNGNDVARGGSYGFTERLNYAFNRFLYKTTAVVKVDDVYMDPITEQVLDMNSLIEELRDEVQVSALTFFNILEAIFSDDFDDVVREGIQSDYSGLVTFPIVGEQQTAIDLGESPLPFDDQVFDYTPRYSYPDAVYPLITEDKAAEILGYLEDNVIPNIESDIYNAIEELLNDDTYINGVNKLVDRVVQTVTASDDNIQIEFCIALITFLIAKFEETVLKTKISEFPIPQLFTLGAGFELGIIGAVSKFITTNILTDAFGVSSELTSKSYVAGLGGQIKTTALNQDNIPEKIKNGVEKIQSLIGYGNSDIDTILSYLTVFGGNSSDATIRKIDTSTLTSITQFSDQLNELNLNQYSPQTATTGNGATLKAVVEYEYEGVVSSVFETTSGGVSPSVSPTSFADIASSSVAIKSSKSILGIGTTGYPRVNESGNTVVTSKILSTSSPPLLGGSGVAAGSASEQEVLLNASIPNVTVVSGGSGYSKTKPPTLVFLNNPIPRSAGSGFKSDYTFRRAKGDAMIDDSGHIIGVHMTDLGSGYVNGATIVVDTAHPKTASGENMNVSLTGAVVTSTGANYNPATDSITISYQGEDGNVKTLTATASEINPTGISTSSNELVQVQTVIGKDGSIQQIKRVENFNNLTLRNIISYHKPDDIITTATYETSYVTGLTRVVGIVTASSPFNSSPLLQEAEKVKNSSKIASIKDASGVKGVFNFDNATVMELLYGPGGQILKVNVNKYLEGLAGMPQFTVKSPTGTGMQLELQLSFNIVPADKQDTLDDQVIETVDGQLYVDGLPVFGQTGITTSIDCVGKN